MTLIRSRSSYTYTYQRAYLCVCVCIYLLFIFLLSIPYSWWPNSLFLLDTGILFCPTTSCRPCHPAFLTGFHRCSECTCFSWLSTEILWLSESVDFLSLLDMYLPMFLVWRVCVCVCLCHSVHRQTNRHSREISEIVPAHTRAHTHAEISRTRFSCGGDECDADSLSLRIHIYIHRHTSMHVCLFAFLSVPDSWFPNSESVWLLIQLCDCICIYLLFFGLFF